MDTTDTYASWKQLAKANNKGFDYLLHTEHRPDALWLIAAPHGGGIEPGTTEIARAISHDDLSFYSVEGIKCCDNYDLHLTSHRFDEPTYLFLAGKHEQVLAIHGCGCRLPADVMIWVGGGDAKLVKRAQSMFSDAGFLADIDPLTPGTDPNNLCNRGQHGGGLQLELSEACRANLFESLDRNGRKKPRPDLSRFVAVARNIIGA
jgi:phage replication-related protein YjqB (UPF0714/DUF867 family)